MKSLSCESILELNQSCFKTRQKISALENDSIIQKIFSRNISLFEISVSNYIYVIHQCCEAIATTTADLLSAWLLIIRLSNPTEQHSASSKRAAYLSSRQLIAIKKGNKEFSSSQEALIWPLMLMSDQRSSQSRHTSIHVREARVSFSKL